MRDEVADTSVIIRIVRDPRYDAGVRQRLLDGQIWLPSVVALELFAGAPRYEESRGLHHLMRLSARHDRVLTPTHREWMVGGQLIARASRLYGTIRPRDHLADVLITLIAARLGGTVLTANVAHFERWAELARESGYDVTVTAFG
jgi:predicted nucleic acid-binding protein